MQGQIWRIGLTPVNKTEKLWIWISHEHFIAPTRTYLGFLVLFSAYPRSRQERYLPLLLMPVYLVQFKGLGKP